MRALIVIDMQNDYFESGKMPLFGIGDAFSNCIALVDNAKEKGYKIFFIQHIAKTRNASFFEKNSGGVKLHKDLKTSFGSIITKNYPNSFRKTNLFETLNKNQIKELTMCGAMTHMCVDSTVRAGFDLGFDITLIQDACATKDLIFNNQTIRASEVHKAFIGALGGTFAKISDTKEFIVN